MELIVTGSSKPSRTKGNTVKKRHTSEKKSAFNKKHTLKKKLASKKTQIGSTLKTISEHSENNFLTSENLKNFRAENKKADEVRVRQYSLIYANLEY
jgi:hypothetical protein